MRRTTSVAAALAAWVTLSGLTVPITASANATQTCDGRPATMVVPEAAGASGPQPVVGTPGDDVIVGSVGADTIDGSGGNDTICGLAGGDIIAGGTGDDRLFGGLDHAYVPDNGYYGDTVAPGPGDDYVDLGHDPQSEDLYDVDTGFWDQVSYRDAAGPVVVDLGAGTATGEGTDTLVAPTYAGGIEGSAFNDHLTGSPAHDWITALGGNDHVVTHAGDDRVEADSQDRHPPSSERKPEPGDDVIDTGDGNDIVFGGYGADAITTGEGSDDVYTVAGTGTTVHGGPGADDLWGGGVTTLIGGDGIDTFFPNIESLDIITVRGGPGRDVLRPGADLPLLPHRAAMLIGRPAGTLRIRPNDKAWRTVLRFSSTPVVRPNSIASTLRITWFGTSRRDWLDLEDHEGPVRAFARGGADRIDGGKSRDHLDGGPGRDVLVGNAGRDRCVRGESVDTCELR